MLIPDFSDDDYIGSDRLWAQHLSTSSTVSPFKKALIKGALFICYPFAWLMLLLSCVIWLLLAAAFWLAMPFASVIEREGKLRIGLPWK